jgi:hypothetical protein
MGNSQLQPAHFNKRRHHSKKRGGDGEAAAQGEQVQAEQAQAEQVQGANDKPMANDKNCPCPCPSDAAAEKPSVAQQAENKVKETQAAVLGALTGKTAEVQGAVVGKAQELVGKMNLFVGNDKPAADVQVGGRRKRRSAKRRTTKRRTTKRTKRSTHKRRTTKRSSAKRSSAKRK